VDDVTNLSFPAVRLCSQPSNWAEILEPQKRSDVQDRDDDVKLVKKWLRDGHMPVTGELAAQSPTVKTLRANRQQLRLQGDVLVYNWVDETENRDLFVVPYGMRDMIQRLAYDNTLSGHYGMDHTLERMKRYFFWPGMRKDMEDHVRACSACNRSKHLRRKYRVPLQEFTTGAPMEKVHMDIMGPFPLSTKGNRYILAIVDQFTKWIEAVALPDQTAEMVAKATVDNFFSRFGCPLEIVTDQGTNFTSQLFTELCRLLGIVKKRTTPYHPSANGQVERMNRTILQMIRCTIERSQNNWEDRLQLLMGAMRCTMNRSTGFTPNRLMLGREVRQPLELMTGEQSSQTTTSSYLADLEQAMRNAHETARKALREQQ
jgi:transposase InsO family protein